MAKKNMAQAGLPAVFAAIAQTRDKKALAAALRTGDLEAVDPKTGGA